MFAGLDRRALAGIGSLLFGLHAVSWAWLLALLLDHPKLLSLGALAYFLGLRHAFDADHIAAIDNVTRKLRQDGHRPVAVGLFFSLGHCTVVLLLSVLVAFYAHASQVLLHRAGTAPEWIGTIVSASFLTLIGVVNFAIFRKLRRLFNQARRGQTVDAQAVDSLLAMRGGMNRPLRAVYARIRASWQMLPVGLVFALGFDTATEIALLGISAALADHHGFAPWNALVFPLLFTAGMTLMDTADNLAMLRMYDWAMHDAARKLSFNVAITGLSVCVALSVAGVEWLQLLFERAGLAHSLLDTENRLNFGTLGLGITVLFLFAWALAKRRYHAAARVKLTA